MYLRIFFSNLEKKMSSNSCVVGAFFVASWPMGIKAGIIPTTHGLITSRRAERIGQLFRK